jgi:endopolyphosphatase
MKWLRIQLDIVRERGMKAILIGHVPPARTENKFSWDETCWQKYTLYQRQFRDVIVGSLFGHMNIDHFILHDFKDLKKGTKKGRMGEYIAVKGTQAGISLLEDGEVTVASASDYLSDLGDAWAKLPSPPKSKAKLILPGGGANVDDTESIWQWVKSVFSKSKKSRKGRKGDRSPKERYLHDIGGRYRQRFSVSHVSPSVVPNYFPTIRIFSYNISGLEDILVPGGPQYSHLSPTSSQKPITGDNSFSNDSLWIDDVNEAVIMKKKKKERHAKKRKKYKFVVPSPPSKSAPPGPAYSPQPLTLLGYVQYFANLTYINNDFTAESGKELGEGAEHPENSLLDQSRWSEGKHKKHQGKAPRPTPHPNAFIYEVEYNTTDDKLYRLKDLTVRSYVDLARRIGRDKQGKTSSFQQDWVELENGSEVGEHDDEGYYTEDGYISDDGTDAAFESDEDEYDTERKSGGKRKGKHGKKHKHKPNGAWFTFVKRAFVGTMDANDIEENFDAVQTVGEEFHEEKLMEL